MVLEQGINGDTKSKIVICGLIGKGEAELLKLTGF